MQDKQKEELKSKIKKYFTETSSNEVKVEVYFEVVDLGTTCTISLSKMYQGIAEFVKFQHLNWLSHLLRTEQINLSNQYYVPGCGSCDYGSSDSLDIICYNIKMDEENETIS